MVNEHLLINQATSVHTNTCGPAINMLNIPITEPSVPFFMYCESIAKGKAQILAQPIPATPIIAATTTGFFEKKAYYKLLDGSQTLLAILKRDEASLQKKLGESEI